MAELGSYYITVMPQMNSFTKKVKQELGDLGNQGGKSFANSFSDVLKGSAIGTVLGNIATKIGSSVSDGLQTGINRLDILKNFPKVMEGLGYSTEEADKSIKMIMDHLDGLPTSTQDMVTLTQAISDSTGDLDLATKAALGFNDMMLANGASAAEVSTAQGVLNRVLGKGSATAAQWQSLTSVMPAQLGQVARHMLGASASTEDLHTALEDGTVSWTDFLKAIVELDETGEGAMSSFYEQARNNSVGIGTALENIPNRIGAGWAKILEVIGQKEISSTIDNMSYGVRNAMYGIADTIEALKQKLSEMGVFEKLHQVMEGLGAKFGEFGNAISGAVSAAIPVIAELIDKALQWILDHGDSINSFVDAIGKAFGDIAGTISGALSAAMPTIESLVSNVLTWILDHGELVGTLIKGIAAGLAFKEAAGAVSAIAGVATGFSNLATVLPMVTNLKEIPDAFKLISFEGDPLAGIFAKVAGAADKVVPVIGGVKEGFGALAEALPMVEGFGDLPAAFGLAAESAGPLSGIFSGIGTVLSTLATGPVGIIVAAVIGLVAVIKTLWDTNEGFRNAVMGVWTNVQEHLGAAMERIRGAIDVFAQAFGGIAQTIGPAITGILGLLGQLWEFFCNVLSPGIQGAISMIGSMITGFVDIISGVIQTIAGLIQGFTTGDWTMFTEGLKTIWDGVWTTLTAPVKGLFDGATAILGNFGQTWESAWNGIKSFGAGVWDGLKTDISNMCDSTAKNWDKWTGDLKKGVEDFAGKASQKWGEVKDAAGSHFGKIKDTISSDLGEAKQIGEDASSMFVSALNGDWQDAASSAENLFGDIDSSVTSHLQAAKDSGIPIVSDLADSALSTWENLKSDGTSKFADLASNISDKLNDAKDWANDKAEDIRSFWEGIPGQIVDFFSGLGDRISNAIGSIHMPTPHVTWDTIQVGDMSFGLPRVDWYAKGGVFNTATIIGIGEKGKEAALPLNRKTYGEIAEGIRSEMGGTGVGVLVTGNEFVVREEADIDRIADAITRKVRRANLGGLA